MNHVRSLRFHFTVIAFLVVFNLYGQEIENINADELQDKYLKREKEYEEIWLQGQGYADGEPDSLYVLRDSKYVSKSKNGIIGNLLFFRRSPLSMKSGWTNIFSDEEADFSIILRSWPPTNDDGIKGYILIWLLRNDSLFIKDITLQTARYSPKEKKALPRDTIITRLENFTKCKFKDGLMFVDWISGDFGVITRNPRSAYRSGASTHLEQISIWSEYKESRDTGYLLKFERGRLVDYIDLDDRGHKH